jgi:hypothetical protein
MRSSCPLKKGEQVIENFPDERVSTTAVPKPKSQKQ